MMELQTFPSTWHDARTSGQSHELADLYAAMVEVHKGGKLQRIKKERTARVGTYKYDYAGLPEVLEVASEALAEHGLAIFQPTSTSEGSVTVRTRIAHISGQWMESEMTVKAKGDKPQDIGSAQTYARRYALYGLLGIQPDDDDDGGAEPVKTMGAARAAKPPGGSAPALPASASIEVSAEEAGYFGEADAKEVIRLAQRTRTPTESIKAYLEANGVSTISALPLAAGAALRKKLEEKLLEQQELPT